MPRSVVLVAALLVLAGCGGGQAGSPGPNAPVSGAGSPPAAVVSRVDGTVLDGAGRPVRGALVVPRPVGAGTPGVPEIAIVSDAAGRFTWSLLPGSYELVAQLGERRSAPVAVTVAVTVKAAASSPGVQLVLPD